MRSHTRSLSIKRAASENRGQTSKRTKVNEVAEEAGTSQVRAVSGKQTRRQSKATPPTSHEMSTIAGSLLEIQDAVQGSEDKLGESQTDIVARDLQIDELKAAIKKLE